MADDSCLHFRILDDIAHDLSGDTSFPVCMDAAILIRNTLKDPFANLARVTQAVGFEPLISSKLLRLANSVTYNRAGKSISDLATAISRLGFDVVRTTSLAVAMDQMLKSRNLANFDQIAQRFWEHSVQVSAISRVLARRLGRINPDEAMLAGLVHDIGIFYLLYRAAEYPEYRRNLPTTLELLRGWHESIGANLLQILGLPESITEAVRKHHQLMKVESPSSVRDVLYFADLLADGDQQLLGTDFDAIEIASRAADRDRYTDLLKEAEDDILELRAALSA